MAIRSTTSQFQPIPPNYTTGGNKFHNIGRYQAINAASTSRIGPNMCTAPTTSNNTQYQYVPRLNG